MNEDLLTCIAVMVSLGTFALMFIAFMSYCRFLDNKSENYKKNNLEFLDRQNCKESSWFSNYVLKTLAEHEDKLNQHKLNMSYMETVIYRVENQLDDLEKKNSKGVDKK